MLAYSNLTYCLIVPVLFFLLSACGPTDERTKEIDLQISLQCDGSSDSKGIPQYAVYAHLAENKFKIADIIACDTILPPQYANYNIPESAITAMGGWFSGTGDYIYVDRDSNSLRFFQGWIKGIDSAGVQWQPLAVYEEGVIRALGNE